MFGGAAGAGVKIDKKIFFEKQNYSKMSLYQGMAQRDPTKYPARMGKKWDDEEDIKLLTSIQENKSIADIAAEHERTIGGINSRRKGLAADYWFNDKMPIEEIMTITGLSKEEIEDTIQRRTIANNFKKTTKVLQPLPPSPAPPQSNEITELRREVAELKQTMMEMLKPIKTENTTERRELILRALEVVIDEKKKQILRNSYSKSIPLARFYDQEKITYLEPIFSLLKDVQGRLDDLEKRFS